MKMEDINKVGLMTRGDVRLLPKNFIIMAHNEYNRRWRVDNRDKWNSIRRQNAKKYRKVITQGRNK